MSGQPDDAIAVSVLVVTYNHARFVRQALDGALAQRLPQPFEILISEDCSTDGTREIVQEYAERHPHLVRLLLSERNLRSNEVVARGFRAARGRYVALLDGDDYWTSDDKLRAQVAFLDARPDLTICFHNVQVVDEHSQEHRQALERGPTSRRFPACTSSCAGNFIATSSVVYRRAAVAEIPAWYDGFFPVTDWPLHVLYAREGRIGYLDRTLGAYRLHGGGLFSTLGEREKLEANADFYRRLRAFSPRRARGGGRPRAARLLPRLGRGVPAAWRPSHATALPSVGLGRQVRRRAAEPKQGPSPGRRGRPVSRATVPAVADATRPRWSVMIPTYNCARYLEAALRSVLAQDPGPGGDADRGRRRPLDRRRSGGRGHAARPRDASTSTASPRTSASSRNLNTCLQRSRGELVHLLHGDDFVLEGFYRTLDDRLREHPEAGAAYCRHLYVDERGRRLDVAPLEPASSGILVEGARFLAAEQRIMTPCIVVRRSVYEAARRLRRPAGLRRGLGDVGARGRPLPRVLRGAAACLLPGARRLEHGKEPARAGGASTTRGWRSSSSPAYFEPAERRAVKRAAFSRYADVGARDGAEPAVAGRRRRGARATAGRLETRASHRGPRQGSPGWSPGRSHGA